MAIVNNTAKLKGVGSQRRAPQINCKE